ncbi:MAG TPA: hypothetical protein VHE30_05595 [Polyangiaceae bacterium]|nr:hypothetical protein [Polyangiaceae bacterium]
MTRRLSAAGLAALAASLGCSTSPGGPTLVNVGVYATPAGAPEELAACVTLPVLLGSHVQRHTTVRALRIDVDATRDSVTVSLSGDSGTDATPISVQASQVRAGYSEETTVSTTDGDYAVRVSSSCQGATLP